MDSKNIRHILKYLGHGIGIYVILSHRQLLSEKQVLIYVIMLLTFYVIMENIDVIIQKAKQFFDYMNVKVSIEAMTDVPKKQEQYPPPPIKTPPQSEGQKTIERVGDGYYIPPKTNPQIESNGSREVNGVMVDESIYIDFNNFPQWNLNQPFEYGDSYLPPKDWYPVPPHPPVCVTTRSCPVCPIYTTGLSTDLKQWNDSRRITPPDVINTAYIRDKLNSGR